MDVAHRPGPQNGAVHRSPHTRLLDAWRAGDDSLRPDIALAAVLALAAVWLTVRGWDLSFEGAAHSFGDQASSPPDAEPPPVLVPDELASAPQAWTAAGLVLNLLITLPLIGRRRWPLACLAAQFAVLLPFDNPLNVATLAALLIGVYSLAVYGHSALLSMSVLLATAAVTATVKDDTWPDLPDWAGIFAILLPIGLFGVAVRAARSRARDAHRRAEALEREQQATTELAVAQEQARIARELHDVVSHHVSVMIIQAGAAGKVLDAQPEQAREALAAIEASGRETMTELRHLLGVLTPGPADDLLHPQPGLGQLEALIDSVRQAGQPVSARHTPVALPRGMDLTAYRVVQEALTNALRHAPGARTEITIGTEPSTPATPATPPARPGPAAGSGPSDLVIDVTNAAAPPDAGSGPVTGPGAGPFGGGAGPVGGGGGAGLLGLAERLRLYGGTLQTGPQAGGGFRVRARMPLPADPHRPESLEAG
jgi:signal transduction histidine kinase